MKKTISKYFEIENDFFKFYVKPWFAMIFQEQKYIFQKMQIYPIFSDNLTAIYTYIIHIYAYI